jgi:hypothetical protein
MPYPPYIYRNDKRVGRERHSRSVLRIFSSQRRDGPLMLGAVVDDARLPTQ